VSEGKGSYPGEGKKIPTFTSECRTHGFFINSGELRKRENRDLIEKEDDQEVSWGEKEIQYI